MPDTAVALTESQLRQYVPSIFATAPRGDVSNKYRFMPTSEVLGLLAEEGYHAVRAYQSNSRGPDGRDFSRHIVRLRHQKDIGVPLTTVGDEIAEIVLGNSHNRTCPINFSAGLFRLICSNGLVVNSSDVGSFRIKHIGGQSEKDFQDMILGAIRTISAKLPDIQKRVNDWKAIELTPNEQGVFARAARELLPPDRPISPTDLLRARRAEDRADNLWVTFNRVQENIIKGGVPTQTKTGRRTHTQAVRDLSKETGLDKALWTLTEYFASQKTGS